MNVLLRAGVLKVSSRIIDKVELFSILRKRIGLNEKGIGSVLLIFESILLNLFFQVPSKILSWLQWKVSHITTSSVACYTFHWNGCPQFRLPQLLHFRLKILSEKNKSFHYPSRTVFFWPHCKQLDPTCSWCSYRGQSCVWGFLLIFMPLSTVVEFVVWNFQEKKGH